MAPGWSHQPLQHRPAREVGRAARRGRRLPGVRVLPLQLVPLEALPHLFLAANVPAAGGGGQRRQGTSPKAPPCVPGERRGTSLPSGLCLEPFLRSFLPPPPKLGSLFLPITSIPWFLPGEELGREEQQMLFKSGLLETGSKQAGFVWLPGRAGADAAGTPGRRSQLVPLLHPPPVALPAWSPEGRA